MVAPLAMLWPHGLLGRHATVTNLGAVPVAWVVPLVACLVVWDVVGHDLREVALIPARNPRRHGADYTGELGA